MWFESQNCAMMGVQMTGGKRKLETAATAGGEPCPAKAGRWEPTVAADDCIARLQAVAVPLDAWRPTPTATPPPPPVQATLLPNDDFEDDDDFEDELSDDDRCSGAPVPSRYHSPHPHYDYPPSPPAPRATAANGYPPWHYYAPPPAAQQTIRCEENGKSYLELGAAPTPAPTHNHVATTARSRCCDGRTRWCNVPCYRQRRLAVLNLSMCKLARYRQCSDPSLRRSVLICNTLRHIEREMEAEGGQQPHPHHPAHHPPHQQQSPPPPPPQGAEPAGYGTPPPVAFAECAPHPPAPAPDLYEHSLREFASPSGRATPFPTAAADGDSGIGDEDADAGRSINWGSVLSLTSQTDLEPLNNNELYAELGLAPAHADPTPNDWKEPAAVREGEWDSFMHVLVGGS